ncbi:MAG: alkaline phosphatase [Thiohalocapsa sp.]|nr:alkaline phosphatase [Thiohalocapsa sp.]
MKKHKLPRLLGAAHATLLVALLAPSAGWAAVKNVIVMVPDGCSQSIQTLSRWYKGEPLALDGVLRGLVSTSMADSVITDSAAAGTAFACGHKTSNGFVGVEPRPENLLSTFSPPPDWQPYAPMASVLEGARLTGKATGLVSTSRITHATPASFASHVQSRGMENDIMEQMVYADVDVVFGGGKRHLIPEPVGKRTDGENLLGVLLERGYRFVETKAEMQTLDKGRAWGLFADSHMEADIDRSQFAPEQPSIAEMTAKAIELLAQDEDGFFLMVEGSQVDWAGHANDPIYMLTDFLAFDAAVEIALDFADANGETLVLIAPDHNTGALAIGNNSSPIPYTATSVEDLIEPLKGMQVTSTGLSYILGSNPNAGQIAEAIQTWWGITPTPEEVEEIQRQILDGQSVSYAIAGVIGAGHTLLGWTTHGHSGEDVPLWAHGPEDMLPTGLLDNTDIAHIVADAFGFELKDVTRELFVDAATKFRWKKVELDTTDAENPLLRIRDHYELPANKNLLIRKGPSVDFSCPLEGVVVYAPESAAVRKMYIPQQAVQYMKNWPAMKRHCDITRH